jgi:microcystin-dependent protein
MDNFLGEIRMFSYGMTIKGWAPCNGQLLPIAQNQALFALLGTQFGGNGSTTFGLPDLRGRAPIAQGSGPGLTPRSMGEVGGSAAVTLLTSQLPQHNHGFVASPNVGEGSSPVGALIGQTNNNMFAATANAAMAPMAVQPSGGNTSHLNAQPYLGVNYLIALQGIFPSRP